MLYHYHCHRPWRFAPCPHRVSARPLCFRRVDRVLPPPGFTPPVGGEEGEEARHRPAVACGNSPRTRRPRGALNLRRGRAGERMRGSCCPEIAPIRCGQGDSRRQWTAVLSSEIRALDRGSKDDGTQRRVVAAPSDSKLRTGRPARLNTWEFAAAVATLFSPPFLLFRPRRASPVHRHRYHRPRRHRPR